MIGAVLIGLLLGGIGNDRLTTEETAMERLKYTLSNRGVAPERIGRNECPEPWTGSKNMPKMDLMPMDRAMATKLVNRLLAGYPNLNAHDPEGYLAALIQTMAEFPKWAGERTILKVDEQNSQFPPTEKSLRKWLTDAVSPYRFAAEWEARSRQQIAERGNDEKPAPTFSGVRGDGGPGTIYSNYDLAFEKHGRPRGFFEKE